MSLPDSPPPEPQSHTGTWIATLLLIVAFVFGLLIFPPRFEAPETDAAQMVLFIGRFHPILLHLPVGALGLLVIMELLCLRRAGEEKLGAAALLTLWVGSAGAVAAVLAGIMLSREGGYEGASFSLHQTLALIGTSGILLALVIRLTAMTQGNQDLLHAYRAVYFLSFGLMGLGAHFGGNLSHGSKYLTEHAPESLKTPMVVAEKWLLSFAEKPKTEAAEDPPPVPAITEVPKPPDQITPPAPAPAGAEEKLVFQHVILPIFESKCNKCHNEEKAKAELRLDTYELAMKGGENSEGTNIVPGKPDESASVQRIQLPESDDEHMPPEGKPQPTAEETALLVWWIQQGASNTLKVADAQFPPETQATVNALLSAANQGAQ